VLRRQQPVPGTDGRESDITLYSAALSQTTHVDVILPRGYDASGRTRYPVLYLLHGVGGSYQDWSEHGLERVVDRTSSVAGLAPFLTVTPDGGTVGFYTDWYGNDAYRYASTPPPAWESYHVNELIPWVDSHYPTIADRSGRAIAGLSMGGFGAMGYAAKHPDLFAVAGSFSGAVDTDHNYPRANEMLDLSTGFRGALPNHCIWGDPYNQDLHWRAADPTYLASNLQGVSLYLASGNGRPGPFDHRSAGLYPMEAIERFIWPMNQSMDAALNADGIAHVDDFYGNGVHDWPYWLRDLSHFLPQMDAAFSTGRSRPPAAAFSYRTAAPRFSVWGWSFVSHRDMPEFTYLSDVGPTGFQVSGSGTLSVLTPPLFEPSSAATVTVGGTRRTVVADARGRLAMDVDLGPSHTAQQTAFDANAQASWVHPAVTIAGRPAPATSPVSMTSVISQTPVSGLPETAPESRVRVAGWILAIAMLPALAWAGRRAVRTRPGEPAAAGSTGPSSRRPKSRVNPYPVTGSVPDDVPPRACESSRS
jgi:S-formylglutathione hydrolase FrmB